VVDNWESHWELIAIDDRHLLVGLLAWEPLLMGRHEHHRVIVVDNMRTMSNEDRVLLRGTEDQVPFTSRVLTRR